MFTFFRHLGHLKPSVVDHKTLLNWPMGKTLNLTCSIRLKDEPFERTLKRQIFGESLGNKMIAESFGRSSQSFNVTDMYLNIAYLLILYVWGT